MVDVHPARLTIAELTLRVACDSDDPAERLDIAEGIRNLRRQGVFRYRSDDELVEVTPTAMYVYVLVSELAKIAREPTD